MFFFFISLIHPVSCSHNTVPKGNLTNFNGHFFKHSTLTVTIVTNLIKNDFHFANVMAMTNEPWAHNARLVPKLFPAGPSFGS